MKKIYSFTLSSDEYPSSSRKFAEDLRLIAHMVYSEIYNYYDDSQLVLNVNISLLSVSLGYLLNSGAKILHFF